MNPLTIDSLINATDTEQLSSLLLGTSINTFGDDTNWTWNPFDKSRKIFFISDVPHLLKTTRNNLENSLFNRNSRNLHVSTVLLVPIYLMYFHAQRDPKVPIQVELERNTFKKWKMAFEFS